MSGKPEDALRLIGRAAAALLLSSCTSTQDVLEPSAITPPSQAAEATPNATANAAPAIDLAALTRAKIQFAPIVGTSVEAAAALSTRLSSRARARGIRLTGSAEPPTHLLKGYFSPLVEGGETTVIYVWDVYDPSGNRVHRISGQQQSRSSGGGEGWSAVPDASMQAVADTTIDQLAAWLAASGD